MVNEDIARIGRGFSNNLHVFYLTGDSENAPRRTILTCSKTPITPFNANPPDAKIKEAMVWHSTLSHRAH